MPVTVRPPNVVGTYVSLTVDTDGQKKYEHLSFVGKAALTLSHGNIAAERVVFVNNVFLTKKI